MKYKKNFFMLLLALPTIVGAQTLNNAQLVQTFPSPTPMPSANQMLVRNWDDRYVVSYHLNSSGQYVSCTDYSDFYNFYSMTYSPALYSYSIPNTYLIRDMEIVDDILFFCGNYHSSTVHYGIVGWFDLNLFMAGTFSPHVITIPPVYDLSKMVAYQSASGYKVIAVGFNDTIPVPPYSLHDNSTIVEINDVTGTPSCNYAIIDRNTANNEYIYDVVYTGSSVVFVGVIKQLSSRVYHIRIMDDPDNLSASLYGDNIYYFNGGSSSPEVNGHTLPTFLDRDQIAITYVHYDHSTYTSETRLRVVKTTPPLPGNINSQSISKDAKEEPVDLVYSKKDDALVLLQNIKHIVDDHPQFVFLKPYFTTSYYANLLHFSWGETHNSLDIYNKKNIVSVGNENKTYLQVITSPTLPNCLGIDKAKVAVLPNDNAFSTYDPLIWQTWSVSSLNSSGANNSDSWNAQCFN